MQTSELTFFNALLKYASFGKKTWHCPGHSGGEAYKKTELGKVFYDFYGENLLKTDVCNAVEDLGQLLDHTGPVLASERLAAQIYNTDHLFFVTNGTSTSNKIVWNAFVAEGDIVVVDRNCHKSVLHAIMMTGAIPIYLSPSRNHHGMIGPISEEQFSQASIQKKIDENPWITDKTQKPRLFVLTQSTYDGTLYNTRKIKESLDGFVDVLHFDEAWLPHAVFHPFYKDMHAIDNREGRTQKSLVVATQSTHKMLAGLSQASQILISDSESKKLNTTIFNEAFMMHTSTSPLYSIIASCDVSAQMMAGKTGEKLIAEALQEALLFRQELAKMGSEKRANDWWFTTWGPDTNSLAAKNWNIQKGDAWHGFQADQAEFNRLDPLKCTILTPGLDLEGQFADLGIPAPIVAKYLAENGVIVEKYGHYSLFIMFTLGITRQKWQALLATLKIFKEDYKRDVPVFEAMPEFALKYPQYRNLGLRTLCDKIHSAYSAANIAKLTTEVYTSEIEMHMKPSIAFKHLAHEKIERVPIEKLEGRTTAVLLTPYPPGIPLLVPGEKINSKIVEYLKFAQDFNQKYPGFETDIHGLVSNTLDEKKCYFVDCIVGE